MRDILIDVDESVHTLSRWQALIKLRVKSLYRMARPFVRLPHAPPAALCPQDFPFLPFPFSQDHCFRGESGKAIRRSPARGAADCYERICGNPRSNLHADGNGCVSSLIPRFCRLSTSRVVFARECGGSLDGDAGDRWCFISAPCAHLRRNVRKNLIML